MRITRKKLILIVICILLGVTAAYAETSYIRGVYAEVKYVKVAFAKNDIAVNRLITTSDMEFKDFPEGLVSSAMVKDPDQVKGKVAARDIRAGSPLYLYDISDRDVPVVKDGMVSVTFDTDLSGALAGYIQGGDYADIGFVGEKGLEARQLFSRVQVLRVTNKNGAELSGEKRQDNQYDNQSVIPATVTVILAPDDAVTLKQHEAMGELFLMGVK